MGRRSGVDKRKICRKNLRIMGRVVSVTLEMVVIVTIVVMVIMVTKVNCKKKSKTTTTTTKPTTTTEIAEENSQPENSNSFTFQGQPNVMMNPHLLLSPQFMLNNLQSLMASQQSFLANSMLGQQNLFPAGVNYFPAQNSFMMQQQPNNYNAVNQPNGNANYNPHFQPRSSSQAWGPPQQYSAPKGTINLTQIAGRLNVHI